MIAGFAIQILCFGRHIVGAGRRPTRLAPIPIDEIHDADIGKNQEDEPETGGQDDRDSTGRDACDDQQEKEDDAQALD
jgi:hypothetical protein